MPAINVSAVVKSLYRAAWAVAVPLARLAAFAPGKLGRTVRGRLAALQAIRSQVPAPPSLRSSPLLWFHAASVGEGRQALAVMTALRTARPGWRFAYTFSSSSAEAFARGLPGVEVAAYLPPDTVRAAGAALDALRPAAVVFAATDVWPELVRQSAHRGVRVALVSANLGAGSSRRGALARAVLREAYGALDAVGAIDAPDAGLLAELGVPGDRIRVTGDSRHDAALERAAVATPAREALVRLLAPAAGAPILAAGSTWPSDERVLLPAVAAVRRRTGLRLLIAPHEPEPDALARLEARLAAALGPDARVRRLAVLERADAPQPWDVCIVDRVGVLFDCYAAAAVAYVGGGFHAAGLHSVIEPAAFGVPVLFGPRRHASRDARLLLEAGGAAGVASTHQLVSRLLAWIPPSPARQTARAAAGAAARAVVERGAGAARRSAQLVVELVERPGPAGC